MKYDDPIIVKRKKDETDVEFLWRCVQELTNSHNMLIKQVSDLTIAVGRLEGKTESHKWEFKDIRFSKTLPPR
jgi:hypothetical protein